VRPSLEGIYDRRPFDLSQSEMEAMFERHRAAGARFIAPYYLYAVPDRITPPENQLHEWRITKDNPKYGSATLYRAISDLIRNH
jgi:hypothetical protein